MSNLNTYTMKKGLFLSFVAIIFATCLVRANPPTQEKPITVCSTLQSGYSPVFAVVSFESSYEFPVISGVQTLIGDTAGGGYTPKFKTENTKEPTDYGIYVISIYTISHNIYRGELGGDTIRRLQCFV